MEELEWNVIDEEPWHDYIFEFRQANNIAFIRRVDDDLIYLYNGNIWMCTVCETELHRTDIAHTILDGPGGESGSGRCKYEQGVPYCPVCDEKPNFHGTPITDPKYFD